MGISLFNALLAAVVSSFVFGLKGGIAVVALYVLWLVYAVQSLPRRKPMEIKDRKDITRDGFAKRKIPQEIDAIIIGSGVGSLLCGAVMSRWGKTVLLLEQHYIAGGCTHTYDDRGYEFDTGLHYVNNYIVAEKMFDLATGSGKPIRFAKMGSKEDDYMHDKIILEGEKEVVFDCRQYGVFQDLIKRFPHEKKGILDLRSEIAPSQNLLALDIICKSFPIWFRRLVFRFVPQSWIKASAASGPELIGEYVKDKMAQAVLLGRFGDVGGPPDQVSLAVTVAVIEAFAQDGGAYPIGGPGSIARALIPVIEASGGRVLVRAPVSEIIVENGVAKGVRVKGEEIRCNTIISGAGAWTTFSKLLPQPYIRPDILKLIDRAGPSTSHFFLFLGLKGSQEELKLPSSNFWVLPASPPDYDLNKSVRAFMKDPLHAPLSYFFGFPSAKDPTYNERNPGKSVCIAFTEAEWSWVEEWGDSVDGKRPEDYAKFKTALGERILESLLKRMPELKDKIEFKDFASPLTNRHYLNAQRGESLGVRYNPTRIIDPEIDAVLRPQTYIKNLYLTGQDAAIPGIFGAMVGGLVTANLMASMPDVIAHPGLLRQFIKMQIDIVNHFSETRKLVV